VLVAEDLAHSAVGFGIVFGLLRAKALRRRREKPIHLSLSPRRWNALSSTRW